jgi:hypothetical protein
VIIERGPVHREPRLGESVHDHLTGGTFIVRAKRREGYILIVSSMDMSGLLLWRRVNVPIAQNEACPGYEKFIKNMLCLS